MLYIVEVGIAAENLAHELSQMRTWLDHMKYQAIGFRQIPGANIWRVDFKSEQEARAFAEAFCGAECRHIFHRSARQWGRACGCGWHLTVANLQDGNPAAYTLAGEGKAPASLPGEGKSPPRS
jgi:hypothetical protein